MITWQIVINHIDIDIKQHLQHRWIDFGPSGLLRFPEWGLWLWEDARIILQSRQVVLLYKSQMQTVQVTLECKNNDNKDLNLNQDSSQHDSTHQEAHTTQSPV